jgi:hypothetical protein
MHPPALNVGRHSVSEDPIPTTHAESPARTCWTHRRVCPGCLQRVWCACSLGSVRAGFPTRWAAAAVLGRPGRWREEQQQRRNSGTTHLYPNARTRVSRIFIHSTPTPPPPLLNTTLAILSHPSGAVFFLFVFFLALSLLGLFLLLQALGIAFVFVVA